LRVRGPIFDVNPYDVTTYNKCQKRQNKPKSPFVSGKLARCENMVKSAKMGKH